MQQGNTCNEQRNSRHQADAQLDEWLIGKEFDAVQSQDEEEKSKSCQDICCDHHGSGQHQLHCRTKADRSSAQGMEAQVGNGIRSHRNIFFWGEVLSTFPWD